MKIIGSFDNSVWQLRKLTIKTFKVRIFLLTLLLWLFHLTLYADTGNCIRYKAKFELKSGKMVEGYFYYATYDTLTFKFTNESFHKFMDHFFSRHSDTLILYLKIQTLKYPQSPSSYEGLYQFQAAVPDDIIKLSRKNILVSYFIDYLPPDEWNLPKEKWNFYCNGQSIIDELTQKEIDLLQQKPVAQYSFSSYDHALNSDYNLVSYNSEINENDLMLFKEKLNTLNKIILECKEQNSFICYQREYLKIKDELNKKRVILFSWSGAI